MTDAIVPEERVIDDPAYWSAIYADLMQKMTPAAADEQIGLQAGSIAAAIKRREIKPYQFSARKVYVTPCLIAKWAVEHKQTYQAELLPS